MSDILRNRMVAYPIEYATDHLKESTFNLSDEERTSIRDNLCFFVRSIPSSWDSELKLRLIYNVVTRLVTYDRNSPDRYSYVGCLEGKAVCMGVAELITLLCKALKIKCMTIIGFGGNYVTGQEKDDDTHGPHAWNIVWIEDEERQALVPYHIDATWDLKKNDFQFYLKDDDYMKKTGHLWLPERYPECTVSTYFDGTQISEKVVELACQIFPREILSD